MTDRWIVGRVIISPKICSALFEPAGKYPHNPFVGPRPMKFPNTFAAQFAQFPYVYYWRYSKWMRPGFYSFFTIMYINYKIQQLVNTPSNIEEWRVRRNEWYTKKVDPEDAYF